MQVSVESTSNIERVLTVQVPAERIDTEVAARLQRLKNQVRLDGFRPGKVPLKVVKQRYGNSVYSEVLGEVMQSSFEEAVTQEQLKPAGAPSIEPISVQPGEALEYKATFEVYPEIELADMSDVQITRPVVEIESADVDKMIEKLREQRRNWEPVERAAAEGDQVVIDFTGYIDGEAFEGGQGQDMPVVLGEGQMIPGFEEQLLGVKAGDEKSIEVTFPEDYHAEKLAGKAARFEIKVKAVNEARLPEIDDEFCKQFGVEEGGIERLREEIKANMERELNQAIKGKLKQQAMDALLEKHDVEVPKSLVKEEINRLKQQAAQSSGQQDLSAMPDEIFEDEAKRRVSLGLIVGQVIKDHDLKLDQDRVEAALDELASSYEDSEQVKQYYRSNRDQMSMLEAMVLEEQVVDWVVSQAQVSEDKQSFDDLMNPKSNEG